MLSWYIYKDIRERDRRETGGEETHEKRDRRRRDREIAKIVPQIAAMPCHLLPCCLLPGAAIAREYVNRQSTCFYVYAGARGAGEKERRSECSARACHLQQVCGEYSRCVGEVCRCCFTLAAVQAHVCAVCRTTPASRAAVTNVTPEAACT